MALEITKIFNQELRKLAYLEDRDNSQTLDDKEFAIFKKKAAKMENISAEDFNQAMGLYISKPTEENKKVENTSIQDRINNKHIETTESILEYKVQAHDTWRGIVNAFYPLLVESNNGKVFGEDGAIRALKKALCTDEDGNLNKTMYEELLNSKSLPKTLKLPPAINDCPRVDSNTPEKYPFSIAI